MTIADIDTRPPLDLEPIRQRVADADRFAWSAIRGPAADTASAADVPDLIAEVERLRARLRGDTPISLCEWCGQPVTVGQSFAYQPGTGGLVEHTACATP